MVPKSDVVGQLPLGFESIAVDPTSLILVPKPFNNAFLKDKILGILFGNALGDAIGLATEFLTKELR